MTQATMTETQARSFAGFSVGNAIMAETGRVCGCKAYKDIFTYGRWQALGFQVRRGEHGSRLPLVKDVVKEDEDGQEKSRRVLGSSVVFCRCQVDAKDGQPTAETLVEYKGESHNGNEQSNRSNPETASSKYQLKRI